MFKYEPKKKDLKESDQDGPPSAVKNETSLSLIGGVGLSEAVLLRSGVLSEVAIVRMAGQRKTGNFMVNFGWFRGSAVVQHETELSAVPFIVNEPCQIYA